MKGCAHGCNTRAVVGRVLLAGAATVVFACGGEPDRGEAGGAASSGVPTVRATAEEPEAAPEGAELARLSTQGETLFRDRGCVGCHAIGGEAAAAPDLKGVTERRPYGWIVDMITRPDSMTANDTIARGLLAKHMTQMPNLSVQREEARAIYAYLRVAGE